MASWVGKKKMSTLDPEVMFKPEIQKIIGDAMKEFGEKMKKSEEIFSKYGKGSYQDSGSGEEPEDKSGSLK